MSEKPAVTSYRIGEAKRSFRRDVAELMYHYPQIRTIRQAMDMPVGDRRVLLSFARMHEAECSLDLLNVFAAAQSNAGYKSLSADLKGAIKELANQL